jgi:hypothetical protein
MMLNHMWVFDRSSIFGRMRFYMSWFYGSWFM